jgi:hypothetical protein
MWCTYVLSIITVQEIRTISNFKCLFICKHSAHRQTSEWQECFGSLNVRDKFLISKNDSSDNSEKHHTTEEVHTIHKAWKAGDASLLPTVQNWAPFWSPSYKSLWSWWKYFNRTVADNCLPVYMISDAAWTDDQRLPHIPRVSSAFRWYALLLSPCLSEPLQYKFSNDLVCGTMYSVLFFI